MNIDLFDCFCDPISNTGNRAAVVTRFEADSVDKQTLAAQLNCPVTVFISDLNSDIPQVEFFYPTTEMPLCLHGSIAAGKFVLNLRGDNHCQLVTSKSYLLDLTQKDELLQVKVSCQFSPVIATDYAVVCSMLDLPNQHLLNDMNFSITVASVGSPKLLIPIQSEKDLLNLSPNFELIKEWSLDNNVNGLYVFAPADDHNYDFVARGINPKTGHNEDAATGVAAAALALNLKKSIRVKQGENLGRPCCIAVTYVDDGTILVGGEVKKKK